MKRRQFLYTSASVVCSPLLTGTAASASTGERKVDFGRVAVSLSRDLGTDNLKPQLHDLADVICTGSEAVHWDTSEDLLGTIEETDSTARRLKFVIEALHERGLATAIERDWVTEIRSGLTPAMRVIPLVGGFNNVYKAAKELHEADAPPSEISQSTYDQFKFALLAFGLEVGLFYVGAPYKMAWTGTRFISNRTVLRLGRWVDYRMIALVMSEIHVTIRAAVYAEINDDNLESTWEYAQTLKTTVEEFKQWAQEQDIKTEDGRSYLETVDLELQTPDIAQYEFVVDEVAGELTVEDIEGEFVVTEGTVSSEEAADESEGGLIPLPVDGFGL
ncbi:hypothetical protein [Halomicrobium salinisoli]|uniref:hypothetical protein n=1 Tax=Halomicrobium salinisoli TaxID=2878391 RepID=UPI001CF02DB6|nr:hypothetical protein [Halomicrobium salinisoli]